MLKRNHTDGISGLDLLTLAPRGGKWGQQEFSYDLLRGLHSTTCLSVYC